MCENSERRYFNYYDTEERLPNQILLLEKLEEMNYEKDGRYILTNKKLGVPITIMLLLMKESMDLLFKEQDKLNDLHQIKGKFTTKQMKDDFCLKTIDTLEIDIENYNWYFKQISYLEQVPSVSGCTVSVNTNILVPIEEFPRDIDSTFYSDNPNVFFHKNVVEVKPRNPDKHSMINIFKYTIQFLEFSYAVSQRLEAEQSKYKELFSIDINFLEKGPIFDSNCMKRKDFIHGGNLNIDINPKDSQLTLGKNNLVNILNTGFDEACFWVDSIYGLMLEGIASV